MRAPTSHIQESVDTFMPEVEAVESVSDNGNNNSTKEQNQTEPFSSIIFLRVIVTSFRTLGFSFLIGNPGLISVIPGSHYDVPLLHGGSVVGPADLHWIVVQCVQLVLCLPASAMDTQFPASRISPPAVEADFGLVSSCHTNMRSSFTVLMGGPGTADRSASGTEVVEYQLHTHVGELRMVMFTFRYTLDRALSSTSRANLPLGIW